MTTATMATTAASIPSQMQAQQLHAYNEPYRLVHDAAVPVPTKPNDILLRVDAASYCHTDAVLAAGQMPRLPLSFPHVGSHEFAGTVVAHADNASSQASSLRPGTRVGVGGRANRPCGECAECLKTAGNPQDNDDKGYSVYCNNAGNNGISVDGGFREYAVVDARQVAPLPSAIAPVDAAPLMCAGVTIYGALKRCQPELKPGGAVGIVGCGGGLGHLGLQMASKMGYRVVGIDNTDAALALSTELDLGSRVHIFDTRKMDAQQVVDQVSQQQRGDDNNDDDDKPKTVGLDALIILPEAQPAFDYGMKLLRNHGKCVVVSFPEKGFHMSARDLVFRGITIVGSLVGSNKLLREMLEFASVHDVKAKVKTFPLAKLNELVEAYHRGEGGKLVVDLSLKE